MRVTPLAFIAGTWATAWLAPLVVQAQNGEMDGRQKQMMADMNSPRHKAELERNGIISEPARKLVAATCRRLLDPPLAPSFAKLQSLVQDVAKDREGKVEKQTDPSILPCLLRKGGCSSSEQRPDKTKNNAESGKALKKTEASIEEAVTKLQKDLDMRTAEVVKEIERRAAEMRREIAIEAEQLIEAVKYLVTLLSDSVTRADELGQGFVREWYDEAEQRFVGFESSKKLDEDIQSLNDDLKQQNANAHKEMVDNLKERIKKTREKYGQPKSAEQSDESSSDATESQPTTVQSSSASEQSPVEKSPTAEEPPPQAASGDEQGDQAGSDGPPPFTTSEQTTITTATDSSSSSSSSTSSASSVSFSKHGKKQGGEEGDGSHRKEFNFGFIEALEDEAAAPMEVIA